MTNAQIMKYGMSGVRRHDKCSSLTGVGNRKYDWSFCAVGKHAHLSESERGHVCTCTIPRLYLTLDTNGKPF